jgi:hypothetical protein
MDYIKYLDTYSFGEILEVNDLDEADVLRLLVDEGLIKLQQPRPVDYEQDTSS